MLERILSVLAGVILMAFIIFCFVGAVVLMGDGKFMLSALMLAALCAIGRLLWVFIDS